MKRFRYTTTTELGTKEKGSILAANKEEVLHNLKQENKIVLDLHEESKGNAGFFNTPSLSFEELLMLTKHLGTMVDAGITLSEAFMTFAEQEGNSNKRKMYENILELITSGQSLSASLKVYPTVFSDIYINMISVGEESGTLGETLQYLDIQLEKENELRKKVISALIYPGVIVSITCLLTMGIVLFIIPKITKIFDTLGGVLPLPTRIMIGLSTFLLEHPIKAFLGAILIIFGIRGLLKMKALKPFWHSLALHFPVIGKIFVNVNLARFSRNINSLLKAGVSITRALDITSEMFTNHFYHAKVKEAGMRVEQGSKLYEALQGDAKLFPNIMVKMIQIGEKTGNLGKTTGQLAELYEREVDNQTRNLSVLLEPLLLLFMGVMVGGVALSIILPIYQIPNLISK